MRLLVTGGAGFIGSHIVRAALAAGFEVAVLDNFSSGKPENVPEGVRVLPVDLRDRDATFRALEELQPELVSHQAAQASVPVSMKDPRFDAEVNVIGGLNLLDACTAPGSRVRHVVFASTGGAIYGEVPDGERAAEDFRLEPKSPYGIHKLTFERLLGVYREHRGLATTVLRYANVYGPRQDPHGEAGVVAIFFDSALAGKNLTIFAKRTPSDTTTMQLAERVLSLTAARSTIEHAGVRPGDIERSLLDSTRFEQTLGMPTPLYAGLDETARWYRER
jgi:UDP-glucose 4-epimerase